MRQQHAAVLFQNSLLELRDITISSSRLGSKLQHSNDMNQHTRDKFDLYYLLPNGNALDYV
jgi:hypothetical protein